MLPYAFHIRGSVIGFASAKAAQSIRILKNSGYDGYMSIEFEGGDDALWAINAGLSNLKRYLEL